MVTKSLRFKDSLLLDPYVRTPCDLDMSFVELALSEINDARVTPVRVNCK